MRNRSKLEVRTAAHAYDNHLKQGGAVIGIAGVPVQVRNPDDTGIQTIEAAFMTASLPVAGFSVFEAADLAEAVEFASHTPCAVDHGVVEIWPIKES